MNNILKTVGGTSIRVVETDPVFNAWKASTFEKFYNDTNTDVDTMKTKVTTLETDVGTMKTKVTTLETDVGTMNTKVTTLETDVGTLGSTVGMLDTNVSVLNTDVEKIEADITTIKDELNNIQPGSSSLQTLFYAGQPDYFALLTVLNPDTFTLVCTGAIEVEQFENMGNIPTVLIGKTFSLYGPGLRFETGTLKFTAKGFNFTNVYASALEGTLFGIRKG